MKIWIAGSMHTGTTIMCQIIKDLMDVKYNGTEHALLVAANHDILKGTRWNKEPVTKQLRVRKSMMEVMNCPSVLKDPMLVMTWPVWLEHEAGPDRWIICMRSPEPLVHSWSGLPHELHNRRLAVAQQITSSFELAQYSHSIIVTIPDDLNANRYARKVAAITGLKEIDCLEVVKKYLKPERYTKRG